MEIYYIYFYFLINLSNNILALIGSERDSKFSDNHLITWNDNKKEIFKLLRFISKKRIMKLNNIYSYF